MTTPALSAPQGRRLYVDTRCGQAHVRCFAPDIPRVVAPLVLVHQTASTSREYLALARILAQDRAVYAIDLPGYGGSDPLSQPESIDTLAETVLDAVQALIPSAGLGEVDVMGTHGGSFVAAQMALSPRRLVRKLVCAGLALDVGPAPGQRPFHVSDEPFADIITRVAATLGRLAQSVTDEGLDPEELSLWLVDGLRAYDRRWFLFGSVMAYPILERLSTLSLPTLILALEDDMHALTLQAADALPNATLRDLKALGALPYHRAPQAVADAVASFLDA